MPRYEIPGDPIRVAYGYDEILGVFLSVFDKRLEYNECASEAVNAVIENIGVKDGGGSYFDLHTGVHGFGIKVDDRTMATFLTRYGVTDEQIGALPLHLAMKMDHSCSQGEKRKGKCSVCKIETAKTCSNCQTMFYCSPECFKKAWPVHKLFCGKRLEGKKKAQHIQALFLPQDGGGPRFVDLPLTQQRDDCEGVFLSLDTSQHIQGPIGTWRSDFFQKQDLTWQDAYDILYKDDFLCDGISKENACLKTMTVKVEKSLFGNQRVLPTGKSREMNLGPRIHFKGNLIVVKREKIAGCFLSNSMPEYMDIALEDTHRIAKVLYDANLAYVAG